MFCIYGFSILFNLNEEITLYTAVERGFYFLLLLLMLFLVNFIIRKNNLVKDNSYTILLFVFLLGMFPLSMLNFDLIIANLLLLLAYRRIYSLRTNKDTKNKLFDSAFWIGIATLIYPWSSIMIILIYIAILLFDKSTWRNILIPIIGFITPIFIFASYLVAVNDFDSFSNIINYYHSFSFETYNSFKIIIPLSLVCALILWSIFPTTSKITTINNEFKTSWFLLIFHLLILIPVIILSPLKNSAELLFLFFPSALIFTNYLQIAEEKWFKEVFLYTFLGIMGLVYLL